MKLGPFWSLSKFSKLGASLVLAFYPAFVLGLVAVTQFYLSQANPGCNCYGEKMGIARINFENNWQVGNYVIGLFEVAIAAILFWVPWTKGRLIAVVVAIVAGYAAWELYPGYYTVLPTDNERWYIYPLRSVSAGVFVELLRVYVDPILLWRGGCVIGAALATYLLAEVGFLAAWFVKKMRSRKDAPVQVDAGTQA